MSRYNQSNEEIYSIISSIPKGAKGIWAVATSTIKKALKNSQAIGAPTPAHLAEIRIEFEGTATLGTDYQEMVNATLTREGKEADFESKGTYAKPVSDNLLIWEYSGKNEALFGKLYFRMYIDYMSTGGVNRYFDGNGREMSQKEYEAWLAEYTTPKKNEGANQGTDKIIKPRNYEASNVLMLKRIEVFLDRANGQGEESDREAV